MRSLRRTTTLRLLALALLAAAPACDTDNDEFEEVCCQVGTRFFPEFTKGGVCEIGVDRVEKNLCEPVCCDRGGGLFENTTVGECASIFGRQADPAQCANAADAGAGGAGGAGGGDAGGGGGAGGSDAGGSGEVACTCDQAASFTVVSGCEGAAFSDATTALFCRSAVEFELGADPDAHEIVSGTVLGFEACQVRVTCP